MSKANTKDKFSSKKPSPTRLSYEMVFANRLLKADEYEPDEKILHSDLKKALNEQDDKFDVQLTFEKIKTHEESFIKGMEEGEKMAMEKMKEQISSFHNAVEESQKQIENMMADIKPYMAKLVFDLAESVLDHPIESDHLRERVTQEVHAVLSDVETSMKVRIAVSEYDFEGIQKMVGDRLDADRLEVIPESSFNAGEYKVETSSEVVVKKFKKILEDFKNRIAITPKQEGE